MQKLLKNFTRHVGIKSIQSAGSIVPDRLPFSRLEDIDISHFESIIGAGQVKTGDLDAYNTDWMKVYTGRATCVLLPGSSEEISAILRHCYERRIAVVPQSGNTGLVGGSIPVHDEIVISLRRLNRTFNFDPDTGVLRCDAGFILQAVDEQLARQGHMMPLDLGAKGTCLIGGNVATCAGGIRLIRYGSLHANVVGLKVVDEHPMGQVESVQVLADASGSILDLGSTLKKDNTGLHDHHLFIGSEGQLGIITEVTINAVPRPASVNVAMLGAPTFSACIRILRLARGRLGEILSSFEMIDAEAMRCVQDKEQLEPVLKTNPSFNLLIETSGSDETHDREKIERFLSECMDQGLAIDGALAESSHQAQHMWKLREMAPLAVTKDGYVYKHDVSLPLTHFYGLSEAVKQRVGQLARRVVTYGHLGDGNSHLNVTSNGPSEELYNKLYPFVYQWVIDHGGSISAEHGLGQMKRQYGAWGKSPRRLEMMNKLKKLYDPRGILSPYKALPIS